MDAVVENDTNEVVEVQEIETTETNETQEINQQENTETVEANEVQEETKTFDPLTYEFETEEDNIQEETQEIKYDYETLNISEDLKEKVEPFFNKLAENGVSQNSLEAVIDVFSELFESNIEDDLKTSLTAEEKRNYGVIRNTLTSLKDNVDIDIESALKDANTIKIVNALIQSNNNTSQLNNKDIVSNNKILSENLLTTFRAGIATGKHSTTEKRIAFANSLVEKAVNKDEAKEILASYLK